MKNLIKRAQQSENGAILIVSALIMTAMIAFTALAIDFGYNYFQGAKLQNAVDAAATAAASCITDDEDSIRQVAIDYLDRNGFDINDFDEDKFIVQVETKNTSTPDTMYGESISGGYLKVTVDVKLNTFFGNMLDVSGMHLKKSSFAKCSIKYVNMPKALKYTLFAGSSNGTPGTPAMNITGKLQTGNMSDWIDNVIIGGVENAINGIYQLYYKLANHIDDKWGTQIAAGLTSGDLVRMNTSEAVVNGDVHSNSTIDVGVQAINVTRLKDGVNEVVNTEDGELADDNYGQVTFTAVKSINFSSKKSNTHVYVQNIDNVTRTQETLKLLKMNPEDLTEYETFLDDELAKGDIFESIADSVSTKSGKGQEGNIDISATGINLNNQSSIIYDVEQETANNFINDATTKGWEGLAEERANAGADANTNAYTSDTTSTFSSSTTTDGENPKALAITGTQINRQLDTISTSNVATHTNAKIAMATAFQQNLGSEGYISTPDMSSYFSRQLWNSLKQAANDDTFAYNKNQNVIMAQMIAKLKAKYDKQIEGNGVFYDTSQDSLQKIVDTFNLYKKNGYNDSLTKLEDPKQILSSTVFGSRSPKSASAFVTGGYLALNENNGVNAVNTFKNSINTLSLSYEDKKDYIDSKAVVTKNPKSVPTAQMTGEWLSDSFTGVGTPYYKIDKAWNDAKLSNISGAYLPKINSSEYSVSFKENGNDNGEDVDFDSSKGSVGSGSFGSGWYSGVNNTSTSSSTAFTEGSYVVVNGNLNVTKKNLNLKANTTLVVTGDLNVNNAQLQIRSGVKIYVLGNVYVRDVFIGKDAEIYCKGTFKMWGWFIHDCDGDKNEEDKFTFVAYNYTSDSGAVNVNNDFTVGPEGRLYIANLFQPAACFRNLGTVVVGSVGLIGYDDTDDAFFSSTDFTSMFNYGKFYCIYDFNSVGTVESGDELYIYGNASFATDKSQGSNSLKMTKESKVYIGGYLNSNSNTVWIVDTATNALLSVYGYNQNNNLFAVPMQNCKLISVESKSSTAYFYRSLIFGGSYPSGSIKNAGSIYFFGDVGKSSAVTVTGNSGSIYVDGNVNINALTMSVDSVLYTNYNLTINGLLDNSGAVYVCGNSSIQQIDNKYLFKANGYLTTNKITNSSNFTVLNGVNASESFINSGYVEIVGASTLGAVTNSGIIYENGNLTLTSLNNTGNADINGYLNNTSSNAITASGTGHTYVKGVVSNGKSALNVSNGHEFISFSSISTLSVSSTGGAKVYGVVALNVGANGFVIDSSDEANISELFCGPSSTKNDNYTAVINGLFYFPKLPNNETWKFNSLTIGQYGTAHFQCNIVVSAIEVKFGGSLFVDGETTLSNCYLTLGGSAYFVGGLNIAANKCSSYGTSAADFNINYTSEAPTLYCGGGAGKTMNFTGALQGRGTAVFDCNLRITGYHTNGAVGKDCAILAEQYSRILVSGNVQCSGNAVYVMNDARLSIGGYLDYGICIYNSSKLIAMGGITQNERNDSSNASTNTDNANGNGDGFAIRNGYGDVRTAVMYNGNENSVLTLGGTFQNYGTYYSKGGLYTTSAYKQISIRNQNTAKTFIVGDVYSSSGSAIMNNSMFMCDGDYIARNATKINCDYEIQAKDNFGECYFYVGKNCFANINGGGWSDKDNKSGNTDVFSNSNVYIGGKMYSNAELHLAQNVNFVVKGNKFSATNAYNKYIADNSSINKGIYNNYALYVKYYGTGDNYNAKDIGRDPSYVALDVNICSKLVVGGNTRVDDQCKIRDMAKVYIYGDLVVTDYCELGKSLTGADESQAITSTYKNSGENLRTYKFANAGLVSVSGNMSVNKYCRVYASTSLMVGGDLTTVNWLTLRHDSSLYVGKKCKSGTSIDIGSFAKVHVGGSMQAVMETIKIRDKVTLDVGGNLYANKYIEFGKAGDYTRTYNSNTKEITEYFSGANKTKITDISADIDSVADGSITEDNNNGNDNTGGETEDTSGNSAVVTDQELANDASDPSLGGTFFVGKSIYSYSGYIKIFKGSDVTCGGYVYTPKYITLRSSSSLYVQPEMFGNQTYDPTVNVVDDNDGLLDALKKVFNSAFVAKNGTVYSMGELTLNKNASLVATYDISILGQTVLRQDSLCYCGHDFSLTTNSLQVSWDSIVGNTALTGFDSYGTTTTKDGKQTSYPVMMYAGNNISIVTTISMKLTYMIAGNNVTLYDIYSNADNAESNAIDLPNSICAERGNIYYYGVYSKFGGLFYAPKGNLKLDGFYLEIWGSGIGDTVDVDAYYMNLHRFTNWRTMNLHIAESNSVHLISEDDYNSADVEDD